MAGYAQVTLWESISTMSLQAVMTPRRLNMVAP